MLPGEYDRAIKGPVHLRQQRHGAEPVRQQEQPKVDTVGAIQIGGGGFGAAVQIDDVSHFSPGVGDEAATTRSRSTCDLGNRPGARLLVADDGQREARFGTGGINPNAFE